MLSSARVLIALFALVAFEHLVFAEARQISKQDLKARQHAAAMKKLNDNSKRSHGSGGEPGGVQNITFHNPKARGE